MADIRDCVRSLLPGRARLRHPMLYRLDAESCKEVCGMLEAIPGVTGATVNPRVGSLLITWNEDETTAEDLLATVEGYAAFFFGSVEEECAEPEEGEALPAKSCKAKACGCAARAADLAACAAGKVEEAGVAAFGSAARVLMPATAKRSPRRAARMLQNRTMLGALALSVGALGVKQAGLHLWAGAAFMALLVLHLQQHRRVL